MGLQVDKSHYGDGYDTPGRVFSYWHQMEEVRRFEVPTGDLPSVLEIGLGNGFTSELLRRQGYEVTTLDHDAELKPDVAGSVLELPFASSHFDLITAYQVLEHLPFEKFPFALRELHRVAKRGLLLSLPDCTRCLRIGLTLTKIPKVQLMLNLPRFRNTTHRFAGEHYWEIGKAGYPLKKIIAEIQTAGFTMHRTFRNHEYPYHRFFITGKRTP